MFRDGQSASRPGSTTSRENPIYIPVIRSQGNRRLSGDKSEVRVNQHQQDTNTVDRFTKLNLALNIPANTSCIVSSRPPSLPAPRHWCLRKTLPIKRPKAAHTSHNLMMNLFFSQTGLFRVPFRSGPACWVRTAPSSTGGRRAEPLTRQRPTSPAPSQRRLARRPTNVAVPRAASPACNGTNMTVSNQVEDHRIRHLLLAFI